ncbi:hypothetical protein ABKN59_006765 [Abortiporus biennis]
MILASYLHAWACLNFQREAASKAAGMISGFPFTALAVNRKERQIHFDIHPISSQLLLITDSGIFALEYSAACSRRSNHTHHLPAL